MTMTSYLVDTHVFVWYVQGASRLPKHVMGLLDNAENRIYLSQVSLLELQLKVLLDKLTIDLDLPALVEREVGIGKFEMLMLKNEHIFALAALPVRTGDPFDRLLAAQALSEQVVLITADPRVQQYPISWVWE